MDLKQLHQEVLYNQVRVVTEKAGGSGTVIYSGASADKPTEFHTYVLTCHHVVETAIAVRDEWNPKYGRQMKREYKQTIGVEFFDYENVPHGSRPVNQSVNADLVAYDKDHDMALLKLRTVKKAGSVARLLPATAITDMTIGQRVVAVGCALLHDPILTDGMLTHMGDEIDSKNYWMASAAIIYGNSGGAMFTEHQGSYNFIGIPSRIAIAGWSTPITHLGYFSPIQRVYEFFDDNLYHFLMPRHSHTEEQCLVEQAERREREERRLERDAPQKE